MYGLLKLFILGVLLLARRQLPQGCERVRQVVDDALWSTTVCICGPLLLEAMLASDLFTGTPQHGQLVGVVLDALGFLAVSGDSADVDLLLFF